MSQKEFLEGKREKENGFEVATACWLHKEISYFGLIMCK